MCAARPRRGGGNETGRGAPARAAPAPERAMTHECSAREPESEEGRRRRRSSAASSGRARRRRAAGRGCPSDVRGPHPSAPGAWRPGAERRRREPRASGRLPRQPAARGGRRGGEDWGGGAGPPPVHRTHLWNVLALTEQRRRRAQATLGPCARPPRQAARLIGPRTWFPEARDSQIEVLLVPRPHTALRPGDHMTLELRHMRGGGTQGLRVYLLRTLTCFEQPLCIAPAAEQDIRDTGGPCRCCTHLYAYGGLWALGRCHLKV
ncbi:translation initiation factor IF-2-like [Acinonyx jubatus]|uniref:Translation initiation factor IF-2-like n=1 Tax=Acinonyx jubatus TaxID=32536 RepID=A0ABM3QAY9_ACIJB|nr:translation initiation factor IF-2-like [Acinonyx jubatus]